MVNSFLSWRPDGQTTKPGEPAALRSGASGICAKSAGVGEVRADYSVTLSTSRYAST